MQIHSHMEAKHTRPPQNPIYHQPPATLSDHAFPILAIAVLCITVTAFLLFCYYVFLNKCCFNWRRVHHHLLSWVANFQPRRNEDSFIALSPAMWHHRGLDESVIREIPTFQYRRSEADERSIYGCVVCLIEFQEEDMLRILPNCNHSFHLDCIDIWLQNNSNCPLCRTSISGCDNKYPVDQIIAPSSSPQGSSQAYSDSLMGGDEDFVVIELGAEEEDGVVLPHRQRERDHARLTDHEMQNRSRRSQSPAGKTERKLPKPRRKRHHLSIMGDECIDIREKDDQFSIQPIRRSFSLDSAVDRQLYASVQAIIQQNTHQTGIYTKEESSNRVQTSSFSFSSHRRGSRKAVFPI